MVVARLVTPTKQPVLVDPKPSTAGLLVNSRQKHAAFPIGWMEPNWHGPHTPRDSLRQEWDFRGPTGTEQPVSTSCGFLIQKISDVGFSIRDSQGNHTLRPRL